MAKQCLCTFPVIPKNSSYRIRPTLGCPAHANLAERWSKIKTWRALYDAMAADDPDLPIYEVWLKSHNGYDSEPVPNA